MAIAGRPDMLEASALKKNMGPTPILRGVNLTLSPGRVTGILSLEKIETRLLLNVLAGFEAPDSGSVEATSQVELIPGTTRLFGNLSIIDNLVVGTVGAGAKGGVALLKVIERVRPFLAQFGIERSLETKVSFLTIPEQQALSVVLFLVQDAPILLLRDTFSSLSLDQYKLFVHRTRELATSGRAIAIVPDNPNQLFDVCDEVVILRGGRSILTAPISELDLDEVRNVLLNTEYMINQTLENKFHQFQSQITDAQILFEKTLKVVANFCALPQCLVLSEGIDGQTHLTSNQGWKGSLPSAATAHHGREAIRSQGTDSGSVVLDGQDYAWDALIPGDPSGPLLLFASGSDREFPYPETLALARASVDLLSERMRQEAAARERELQTMRLGQEMNIARNIQASVLPRKLEMLGYTLAASMETATEVGGDSYDLISTPVGNFISVGDVSGHGLPSGIMALIEMAALHGVIQTHLAHDIKPVPSGMYDLVNKVLCEINRDRIGSDKFMTKILLVEKDGHFHHAGTHEIGLLYSRKTGSIRELTHMVDNTGFLGLSEYVESTGSLGEFSMEAGDFLMLYTDGLIEAKDARGDQYGIDRVKQVLLAGPDRSPQQLLEAVRNDLMAFAKDGDRAKHDGHLTDDLTLLVLKKAG